MSRHTFVIAECGGSHEGSLDRAHKLIESAAQAGADAAKFQYWSDPVRLAERRHLPRDTYTRAPVMPLAWAPILQSRCDEHGVAFMCSTYLPEDVATIAPFVDTFKIASLEANDPAHLDAHRRALDADLEARVIVSLGCGASSRIVFSRLGTARVSLLHCIAAYPAPLDSLHLARLHYRPGFSDHTASAVTISGAVAVAAGARIIERHLRLDDTPPTNPDYPHSMTPSGFAQYVTLIRQAEIMLGDEDAPAVADCERALLPHRVLG